MDLASFLNYGLLGLCGLIIYCFWQIIDREQKRHGSMRQGLKWLCAAFIILGLLLAGCGLALELTKTLHDQGIATQYATRIDDLNKQHATKVGTLQNELSNCQTEVAALKERVSGKEETLGQLKIMIQTLSEHVGQIPTSGDLIVRGNATRWAWDTSGGWTTEKTTYYNVVAPKDQLRQQATALESKVNEILQEQRSE
jgi:hypothetical protein